MKAVKYMMILTLASWLGVFLQPAFAQVETGGTTVEKSGEAEETLALDDVIGRLQENYKKINTYQAEFEQEIYSMTQGRVMTRGKGTAFYKKPGKMVWRYQEPEEHLYLTSGNTIWDYSPVDKEAYVLPIKDALYKSFILGLGEIKKDFEVSFHAGRRKSKDGLYQLDLVPGNRAEREAIGTITIYVDPKYFMVRKTEMVDALGNRNRIRFFDIKVNPDLSDTLFKFEPPPGVEVIHAQELAPGGE